MKIKDARDIIASKKRQLANCCEHIESCDISLYKEKEGWHCLLLTFIKFGNKHESRMIFHNALRDTKVTSFCDILDYMCDLVNA